MYDLELDKTVEEIKKSNANKVLIQLADGLKPRGKEIADYIESKCECEVFIWFGDCFGACDFPLSIGNIGVDLIVQFGHSEFSKRSEW